MIHKDGLEHGNTDMVAHKSFKIRTRHIVYMNARNMFLIYIYMSRYTFNSQCLSINPLKR